MYMCDAGTPVSHQTDVFAQVRRDGEAGQTHMGYII